MQQERYPLEMNEDILQFSFVSEGFKGRIIKIIQFTPFPNFNAYNLALLDVLENEVMSDSVVSNNGDMKKVLATVASALYKFTDLHPDTWIYAEASTSSRTRLYQIGIAEHLEAAQKEFEILGQLKNDWYPFRRNVNLEAFLVIRKTNFGR